MQNSSPVPDHARESPFGAEAAFPVADSGSPPLASEGSAPPPTPTWIVPLGICGIVYAALGILANLFGVVSHFMTPWFLAFTAEISGTPFDDESMLRLQDAVFIMALTVIPIGLVAAGLGVSLLVGSIRLARRRPGAVRPLRIWAIGRLIVAGLTVVNIFVMLDPMRTMNEVSGTIAGGAGQSNDLLPIASAFLGAIVVSIAPVAMLILLSNDNARRAIESHGTNA